jgi:UDPglucose 6-dehydrogenase
MGKHNICVIGSGYVGLVTGACLAECGHHVVCVDSDRTKIAALRAGKIPIYEPGLGPLIAKHKKAGTLTFDTSIATAMNRKGRTAEVIFVAVGTPPRADGSADLSSVEAVAREVAQNLKAYALIVDKSTVPVETGDWVAKTVARFNRSKVPYDVASNPEFLSEGSAVHDFFHPDRIILGVPSHRAEKLLRSVYAGIKAPVLLTDVKSAELIKHASNSFLATKISYANAIGILCEKVGADVALVTQGMGMDRRIGPHFLRAGIGFGGFCFPKDLEAFRWIAKQKGYDFKLLEAVREINEQQKNWVVQKLEEELWNLAGKRVALLGLSFKPDTDDLRFAPSLEIISKLQDRGAEVVVYDPIAMPRARQLLRGAHFAKNPYEAVAKADALALITEWAEFKKLDFARVKKLMRTPLLLDGRNLYDPAKMRALGFTYRGVGRP